MGAVKVRVLSVACICSSINRENYKFVQASKDGPYLTILTKLLLTLISLRFRSVVAYGVAEYGLFCNIYRLNMENGIRLITHFVRKLSVLA